MAEKKTAKNPTSTTADSESTDSHRDVSGLSYEQAREELVGTVRALEAGNLPLEESLRLWERGEALADLCQAWLDGAREKLEKAQAARDDASSDS